MKKADVLKLKVGDLIYLRDTDRNSRYHGEGATVEEVVALDVQYTGRRGWKSWPAKLTISNGATVTASTDYQVSEPDGTAIVTRPVKFISKHHDSDEWRVYEQDVSLKSLTVRRPIDIAGVWTDDLETEFIANRKARRAARAAEDAAALTARNKAREDHRAALARIAELAGPGFDVKSEFRFASQAVVQDALRLAEAVAANHTTPTTKDA